MEKELIQGKTQIGKIDGKYEGIYRTFTIFYGNVATPVVNGNVLHLAEDEYMTMLKDFLESDEGKEYRVPTSGEVKSAIRNMINEETRIKIEKEKDEERAQKEKRNIELQKEEEKRKETTELKKREIEAQDQTNRLKKIEVQEIQKKSKLLKIGIIVMVIINVLLIVAVAYIFYKLRGYLI